MKTLLNARSNQLLALVVSLVAASPAFAYSPCGSSSYGGSCGGGGFVVPRLPTCVAPPCNYAPPTCTPSIPSVPQWPACPPVAPPTYGKPQASPPTFQFSPPTGQYAPPTGQYSPPSTDWSKQYGKQRTQQQGAAYGGYGY